MSKSIKVRDLTLCDEREPFSLARLSDENLKRLLPTYRDAHFHILELWREDLTDISERNIDESVWERLRSVERELAGVSLPAVLSNVKTLLGDGGHPTIDLDNACRTAFENGLDVIRITEDENDTDLLKLAINKVTELGGLPDAALRFFMDEEEETPVIVEEKKGFLSRLFGRERKEEIVRELKYGDEYYVRRARELEQAGAKILTLEDSAGLLTPSRLFSLMPKLKISLKIPVDIYVPSLRPEMALANVVMAIIKGVDIVDTSIWSYGGPMGGPSIELVSYFCRKLGLELDVDLKAVGSLRRSMSEIASGLDLPTVKEERPDIAPDHFEQLLESMPYETDSEFDRALTAAGVNDEATLLDACQKIESYFGFIG